MAPPRDLVCVVPDKNTEFTIKGGLRRPSAMGIRPVDSEIIVDPGRDGGVRRRGVQLLAFQRRRFAHALLIFDYEGSGSVESAETLEASLDADLAGAWDDRAKAIVIEPEVDAWMWGAETHLRTAVRWQGPPGILEWLEEQRYEFNSATGKPIRPKEALEAVFRRAGMPRSSAHYAQVAGAISLSRCRDAAFRRLRETLQRWFAAAGPED